MKYTFIVCIISALCVSWIHLAGSNETSVPMSILYTDRKRSNHKTYYSCELETYEPLYIYSVNITVDEPGTLDIQSRHYVVSIDHESSGNDGLWHFVQNVLTSNPRKPLDLDFSLSYGAEPDPPDGVCNWTIQGPFNESYCERSFWLWLFYPCSTLRGGRDSNTTVVNETTTIEPVQEENTTVPSSCLCPCNCNSTPPERMRALMEEILQDLYIAKNSTALAKRKRMSASDKRWISRGIGFVGIIVTAFVFGCILIGDVKFFFRDTRTAIGNVRGRVLSRFLRKKRDG